MVPVASNRVAGAVLLALGALLVPFAVYLGWGPETGAVASLFNDGVYFTVMFGSMLACAARGLLVREERAVWLLVALGLASFTAADLYYTQVFTDPENVPFPSIADALYLGFFPPLYVALCLLVRSRVGSFGPSVWLDGVIAGLTVAAAACGLVFQAVLDATSGSSAAVATNLAYPLADFVLLAIAIGGVAAARWQVDRTWGCVLVALTLFATADSIYLYRSSVGTYVEGTLLDVAWPLAAVLLGVAAWQPSTRVDARIGGWTSIVAPPLFAAVSIGILVLGQFRHVNALAVFLACGALTAALVRLLFTFRENLTYIEQVGHVVEAATAVEAETFEAASLDGVAGRNDAIGNLARVFQRMAQQVYEREQHLKAQVRELKIEIDEARAAKEVADITDTEYFSELQRKADSLRLDSD